MRLILLGLLVITCFFSMPKTYGQKAWRQYVAVLKTWTDGGKIPYLANVVDGTNKLGIYGVFDSAWIFNLTKPDPDYDTRKHITNLYNTLTLKNSVWQSAGYCFFSNSLDYIVSHASINGNDYVTTNEAPYIRKLNRTSNIYDAVTGIKWATDGGYIHYQGSFLVPWGNKAIMAGVFDVQNGPSNIALWDTKNNTFQRIGNQKLGYDPGWVIYGSQSPTDSTLGLLYEKSITRQPNGMRILYKNDTTWANDNYPEAIANANILTVVDKKHMFIGTKGVDSTGKTAAIYSLDMPNKKWTKIATLATENHYSPAIVLSADYGDSIAYFVGTFDSLNGKYLNEHDVLQYNMKTKVLSAVPAARPYVQCLEDGIHITNIAFIEHNLYGIAQCGVSYIAYVYALTNTDGTLPIEVVDFTAESTNLGNKLQWQSTAPTPMYNVQKSSDGSDFKTIAAINGKNNVDANQLFEYLDTKIDNPTNYYRLEMVNNGGTLTYSQIRKVQNGLTNINIQLRNNPVHSVLTVLTTSSITEKVTAQIYSIDGKRMVSTNFVLPIGNSTQNISTSSLQTGLYILVVQSKNKRVTLKFNKG